VKRPGFYPRDFQHFSGFETQVFTDNRPYEVIALTWIRPSTVSQARTGSEHFNVVYPAKRHQQPLDISHGRQICLERDTQLQRSFIYFPKRFDRRSFERALRGTYLDDGFQKILPENYRGIFASIYDPRVEARDFKITYLHADIDRRR
jgi:hypothetical protein